MQDPPRGVEGRQWSEVFTFESQFTVRIVLENHELEAFGKIDKFSSSLGAHGYPGRVLEIGNDICRFDAFSFFLQGLNYFGHEIGSYSLLIERYPDIDTAMGVDSGGCPEIAG